MTTKIFVPAFIADAKQYIHNYLFSEVETIEEAVKITASTVDNLRKGWHVARIETDDDGNIHIYAEKSTSKNADE